VSTFRSWWDALGTRERIGVGAGVAAVVAVTAALGYFTLRPDYQVLFSDLAGPDAAAMVAELDRLKVTYRLSEEGSTILVPRDAVHKTRLKLMGRDIPLRGAVGFELFNNADFGMTEFAQKVNYQRALQGEITRTILSIEDVQFARVHLAIPEQGLFKKSAAKPKASITIAMKPGRTLRAEQVAGIQRLVSASIPDIAAQDVTIVSQGGVALTRAAGVEGEAEAGNSRLDLKRSTEEYLARKAADVLEKAFGRGEALASVDVTLNHDQTKVTTEDVLPAKGGPAANPTGVVVRERQIVRDGTPMPEGSKPQLAAGHTEVDYQVGRRIEQVVSGPGAIQRLGVAVVVKVAADEAQLDRIRDLVAVAVGFDARRGDSIAVYAMDQIAGATAVAAPAAPVAAAQVAAALPVRPAARATPQTESAKAPEIDYVMAAALLAIALLGALAFTRLARRAKASSPRKLTAREREALLANVRRWMDADTAEVKR
jgi:flagellar M-ring protein FliF